jgi:hypothetical protein
LWPMLNRMAYLGVVVHVCNPSFCEAQKGRLCVEASLSNIVRPCLKKQTNNTNNKRKLKLAV